VNSLAEQLAQHNISLDEAALKSGIPLQRLQQALAGDPLSLGEMRKLARSLRIRLGKPSLRRKKSHDVQFLLRRGVKGLNASNAWLIDSLASEVATVVDIANGLPTNTAWINQFPKVAQTPENAEALAQVFRTIYFGNDQQNPLLVLPEIVTESLGLFVLVTKELPIEGAAVRLNDYGLILLAPRSFYPRMLFTLAHELGHFVARHHESTIDFADLDLENDIGSWRRSQSPIEIFADSFASALLLPAGAVARTLKTFREMHAITGELGDVEISLVARFFGVSFEVAGRRCEDLGLLQRHAARAIYEKVTAEHKSPEKRAEEVGLPERPKVSFRPSKQLLRAATDKVKAGEISSGRAAEALHVTISDLFLANVGNR
jgi:Zn-dependent peptidase ImmA (M78 family)